MSVIQQFQDVIRNIFPSLDDRIPLDSSNWPNLLLPKLATFVLAFLNRRPNTEVLRIFLLPIAVFFCMRAGLHFSIIDPEIRANNMALG